MSDRLGKAHALSYKSLNKQDGTRHLNHIFCITSGNSTRQLPASTEPNLSSKCGLLRIFRTMRVDCRDHECSAFTNEIKFYRVCWQKLHSINSAFALTPSSKLMLCALHELFQLTSHSSLGYDLWVGFGVAR